MDWKIGASLSPKGEDRFWAPHTLLDDAGLGFFCKDIGVKYKR